MLHSKDHPIDLIKDWCIEDANNINDLIKHRKWAMMMCGKYAFDKEKRNKWKNYYIEVDEIITMVKKEFGEDYGTTYNILPEKAKEELAGERPLTRDCFTEHVGPEREDMGVAEGESICNRLKDFQRKEQFHPTDSDGCSESGASSPLTELRNGHIVNFGEGTESGSTD